MKEVIVATFIKVLSQMLETDDLATAFNLCLHYLQRLHSRTDVKRNFKGEFQYIVKRKKLLKTEYGCIEARQIIWCVCGLNSFVYDMAQETGVAKKSPELFKRWPCVKIVRKRTKEQIPIDPLRDRKLSDIFEIEKQQFSIAPSLLGQNDAGEELRPQSPSERVETTTDEEYSNDSEHAKVSPSPLTHETPQHHATKSSKVNRELFPKTGTKRRRKEQEQDRKRKHKKKKRL